MSQKNDLRRKDERKPPLKAPQPQHSVDYISTDLKALHQQLNE